MFSRNAIAAVAAAGALVMAPAAYANPLTLTPAGIAAGFTLSTFMTVTGLAGYDGCCNGPFGLATTGTGKVIVNTGYNATRYSLTDVDGQTEGTALNSVSSGSYVAGYAYAGGKVYASSGWSNAAFEELNDDGTVNHTLTFPSQSYIGNYLGMVGHPNGHLIATTAQGLLVDIDPLANAGAGAYTVLASATGDGVSVSPDGSKVYLECGGAICVYDYPTDASNGYHPVSHSPDGTATISGGVYDGFIILNNNDGTVGLVDPVSWIETTIASGGTRGDYVAPDFNPGANFGTLLLDAAETVMRLRISGGTIGTTGDAPEPTTLSLLALSLAGIGAMRRRKRK